MNISKDRLRDDLCKREQLYVNAQLTFSFERKRLLLQENVATRGLVCRQIETCAFPDGRMDVRWKDGSLRYRVFRRDKRVTYAAVT